MKRSSQSKNKELEENLKEPKNASQSQVTIQAPREAEFNQAPPRAVLGSVASPGFIR